MTLRETLDVLLAWTPYMAEGFVMNLHISGLAILIGTAVGLAIGLLRLMQSRFIALGARGATALCRNVPSFVMMFYLAVMLPQEIALPGGGVQPIDPWIKAALALAIPVAGFLSDQIVGAQISRRRLFGPTLRIASAQYAMIIVMASATASVIGADDLVARAGRVAAITDTPGFLTWCYAYAALWFFAFGLLARAGLNFLALQNARD